MKKGRVGGYMSLGFTEKEKPIKKRKRKKKKKKKKLRGFRITLQCVSGLTDAFYFNQGIQGCGDECGRRIWRGIWKGKGPGEGKNSIEVNGGGNISRQMQGVAKEEGTIWVKGWKENREELGEREGGVSREQG